MDLVTFAMLCAVQGSTLLIPCAADNPGSTSSAENALPAPPQHARTTRRPRTRTGVGLAKWQPFIGTAAQRFAVPDAWIRAVMRAESGGRTMRNGRPITSDAGAMGLMQVMPGTYDEMRARYRLGPDPYDPRDNVLAGAAYLRGLYRRYGYPYAFAAYQAGPKRLDDYLLRGKRLPETTRVYLDRMIPGDGIALSRRGRNAESPPSERISQRKAHRAKRPLDALFFVRRADAPPPDSPARFASPKLGTPAATAHTIPPGAESLFVTLSHRAP